MVEQLTAGAEVVLQRLADGIRPYRLESEPTAADKILRDASVAVSTAENARQLFESAGARGFEIPQGLNSFARAGLAWGGRILNGITGARAFLSEFSREYDSGSKLFPRTLTNAVFTVGQTGLAAGAGKSVGLLALGAAGTVVTAAGLTGAAATALTLSAGVIAGAAAAYAVGSAINSLRR